MGVFGSVDYMNLFTPNAPWQKAASRVRVFKLYSETVHNAPDADLTAIFTDLARRNIALAVEWPVLTSSSCGAGIEGFGGGILPAVQRIKALGGNLTYLAMQQPFQWGSLYTGANACQWTAQQVAQNALLEVNAAKSVFPNLRVGDIMAVPPFRAGAPDWPARYGVWFDTWAGLSGTPLAFFDVDVDWQLPNWQAAVAQIQPVAVQHGIPVGLVYNGFLTDESDAAWMAAAESHFVDYEVRGGNPPPEHVHFQSWNPYPTRVLPETDPNAFTYLINRYFRNRTQLTITGAGSQISGRLRAGASPVAGAAIQISARPATVDGSLTTYTITGTVPAQARTAVAGARINTECYNCNGRANLSIYGFQYSETNKAAVTRDFTADLDGWSYGPGSPTFEPAPDPWRQALQITVQPGQTAVLNSSGIEVTPGARFALQITARVNPISIGSGYFTLIWFTAAGNEPSREFSMFQPQTIPMGSAVTSNDGSFSVPNSILGRPGVPVDLNTYQVTVEYAGSDTLWPAIARTGAALTASLSHGGNFAPGQNGAAYTITVSNTGTNATDGSPVTVADIIPTGMTLVSMSGTGWSCVSATCTRSDLLSPSSSYPPITVRVNVAANAAGILTNQASVSGGGSPAMTAFDPTGVSLVGCTYTISTPNVAAPPTGGTGLVTVATAAGCGWTASSGAPWISLGSGGTGSGPGTLAFTAAPNTTGVQRTGVLTVAGLLTGLPVTVTQGAADASKIPALVSINPFQGSGPANLTLTYSHPNGWSAIKSAEFIVNPRWEATTRAGGCYIQYAPATGLFTLIADDGISVAGTAAPGSSTPIANSQCVLNPALSTAAGTGTTLTLVVALTFQPGFTGQRHIWMQAVDYNNLSTNWLVYGVWFPTPTPVAASPWYRIYNPFADAYLYSFDVNEYNTLGARGFRLEGISGLVMNAPTTVGGVSNIAWYRVFVTATSSHLWTSDRNEFLTLVNAQQAYVGEGVAAFVMPYINALGQVSTQVTNTIPFYRAAYSGKNLHFWTPDPDEFYGTNGKKLPNGYFGEGIACYIFPASGAQFSSASAARAEAEGVDAPEVAGTATNGVVAPGQLLSIYGRRLGGTVRINGTPAEVVSSNDGEIRVVAPDDLSGASEATVEIERRGRRSRALTMGVVPANPAILVRNPYGRGHAEAVNEDGQMNDAEHPAARGSVATIYATGLETLDLPVEVRVGGRPAEVIAANRSAVRAGVTEVRIRVPETVEPAAFQPVVLQIGHLFSQPGAGLAVR